jgi:delta-1-pyrroline-5-carboxylate synthetase
MSSQNKDNGANSSYAEPQSRALLRGARRVLVKAGTAIATNEDGHPSLTRLGSIVEQICELHRKGVQVIFVSSGAVGMGTRLLKRQARMNMSMKEIHNEFDEKERKDSIDGGSGTFSSSPPIVGRSPSLVNFLEGSGRPSTAAEREKTYNSACAAAGQFGMMNLYSSLFEQYDVAAAQLLLTQADFQDVTRLKNLQDAIARLMSCGIVPIINENDAVSANLGYLAGDVFSDNDSLAGLCSRHFGAEVCILLTDVEGVYDRPPSEDGAKMLPFYSGIQEIGIGEKSARGR